MVPGVWAAESLCPRAGPLEVALILPSMEPVCCLDLLEKSLYCCAPLKVSTACPFLGSLVGLATEPTPNRKEDKPEHLELGWGDVL